jgi:hypothetical protein
MTTSGEKLKLAAKLSAIRGVLRAYKTKQDLSEAHESLLWIEAITDGDVEARDAGLELLNAALDAEEKGRV